MEFGSSWVLELQMCVSGTLEMILLLYIVDL